VSEGLARVTEKSDFKFFANIFIII
jgi:hypothetical protein